jgi:phospholipase C
MSISRRHFLRGAAATAGLVATERCALFSHPPVPTPGPGTIDHVVVVTMENRSFDHLLGWLPGAEARQAGLTYRDPAGMARATRPLAPDFQGCGHPDPDHSYEGGRVEFNDGACDGWLRAGSNDEYATGYYLRDDLAFLGRAAEDWTVCDHYFPSIMAETFANRMYQHAAQTDRIDNSLSISTLPTIWDRLAAAGRTGRYYYSDVPFLALWGPKYISIGRTFSTFESDCASGRLADVSFVDPRFLNESSGTSNDDHPHADIRNGQVFLNRVYESVTRSPAWPRTMLVICYDEWGGFFDHVAPPTAVTSERDRAAGNADGRLGFRVPCMIVSPYARRKHIANAQLDHTSVLRMIETRWKLTPLTERDRSATSLADMLTLNTPTPDAPRYDVPSGPFGAPCAAAAARAVEDEWPAVLDLARTHGWKE